ncbi:MAG TPA: hypothetical protein VNT81_04420 [Vicinamibacterales bacterium]|nr:hypothetical protein [Vicinamibacterales bacterium]
MTPRETLPVINCGINTAIYTDARIQQRAAGVAGIDGGVRLDDVREALLRHRQVAGARGADHADAHGVAQAERITDRHDPVAGLHLR